MSIDLSKRLTVAEGPDAGRELVADDRVRIVGRATDADLVLSDRRVSRHHFHVHATRMGVQVRVCQGAAPVIHAHREIESGEVKIGESILVGGTVLIVQANEGKEAASQPRTDGLATTVSSLLTGVAADVHGVAAMFALNEALSAAEDISSIETALATWARKYVSCVGAEVAAEPKSSPSTSGATSHVFETATPTGGTKILVPAHAAPAGCISYLTDLASDRITDSMRRMLVLASALCASRLAHLSLFLSVQEDRETLRRQAVGSAHAFLGDSTAAQELVRLVPRLAVSDATVLLTGETGVGKTFVARLIHESGARKDHPLRVINCAAIPENLIESELFGHARGAFTGAVASQVGALEVAGRGTVLLDEIGELPLASQAKLLRVLEEKRFERLGSNRSLPLEARVIAATNRDLEAMVAGGTFRSDLFFRISVIRATVPPLRDRGSDIVMLANQLLADLASSGGRRVQGFAPSALEAVRRYPWPGNVRELRNVIEHALVLGDGPLLEVTDFPAAVRYQPTDRTNMSESDAPVLVELPMKEEDLQAKNREVALLKSAGNKTRAAALLGIERTTFYKKKPST
ncbi:sigma 54-interacting transcriptional regulator [Pendulispora rubella]|uniref:Sigma 54-interacting transcriptional regulator n=1 Tax=Pendulispora rubella TaxID=2741070 RepID=A0ABZ2LDJ1_9BACT